MIKPFNRIGVILITTFIILLTLTLSACKVEIKTVSNDNTITDSNSDLSVPKTVTIAGISYRNGFYGDLWPNNFTFKGDSVNVGDNEFDHINCEKFDWVYSTIDGTTSGILYCEERQWDEAHKYYSDNNNFVYYCSSGEESDIATITNIDSKKFAALMDFAKKNSYDPFGSNEGVKTRRLHNPDMDKSPELIFYKESKDGFFTSFRGYKFHVLDGKMMLVFFYDGGSDELVAVDVPNKLGQYFIKLLQQLRK